MPATYGKCKDNHPLETIRRIREILSELDIGLEEAWKHEVDEYYSVNVKVFETMMYSNGKGTSPEYALASAYGEFMERLQNFELNGLRMYTSFNVLKHSDYVFAPDEKHLSVDELLDSNEGWIDLFTDRAATEEERREMLESWLYENSLGKPEDFISLPYLKINNGNICYIPEVLVQAYLGSNGLCAGNTKEEALVQGISEVMERYVNLKIITERLTPPTIPEEFIRKHSFVWGMIERIIQEGNYRIIVKDCSLGEGLPVVGLIFVDLDTHAYYVKFGAHPVFEIALERCLTELMQGRNLKDKSWMLKFAYSDKSYDSFLNMMSIFNTGKGLYPVEFFGDSFSYSFNEPEDFRSLNNTEMLTTLIRILKERNSEIYIRDVSFLGFPSFQIIVSDMSEGCITCKKVIDLNSLYCETNRTVKRLKHATDKELEKLLEYMDKYMENPRTTLANIIDVPLKNSFPWHGIKRDLLKSAIYYRLGQRGKAYDAMDSFIMEYRGGIARHALSYYECIRDYIGARSDNMDDYSTKQILNCFYPSDLVDKVITDMEDPDQVFNNCAGLNCYDCDSCIYATHCSFQKTSTIHKKLKDRYLENEINQERNIFLYDIYASVNKFKNIDKFDRYIKCVIDMIKDNFYREVDSEHVYMAALEGIFTFIREHPGVSDVNSIALAAIKNILFKIDCYSIFHPYVTGKYIVENIRGSESSFGITVSRIRGRILVCSVLPFSSAYNEGLRTGDEIVLINGICVSDCPIENIYELLCQNKNDKAILGLSSNGQQNIVFKEIVNEKVKIDCVTSMIRNNIGYVRISLFNKRTYEFVNNALAELEKSGVNKIILDLRDTSGGDLKQAALTAGIFVPAGLVARVKFRSPSYKDIEYCSELQSLKYRLVVLINEGTVSSSEMLAGAIQDTKSGLLLGTRTRGKASVQKMIPVLTYEAYMKACKITGVEVVNVDDLKTKYALEPCSDEILGLATLTVGEYFTTGGRQIGGKGLVPDVFADTPKRIKTIHYKGIKRLNPVFDYSIGDECFQIYYAKEILAGAGYRTGKSGMLLDEVTAASIMEFQTDNKLDASGILDIQTQAALNELLETWMFNEDEQYKKAVGILERGQS